MKNYQDPKDFKILFTHYGPNTFTTVTENIANEGRVVFVNGKPDASVPGDEFTRTLTALIPLTLAPKNDEIFIVGLGAGLSTGIASAFSGTQSVKVCEIAKGVIEALPFFEKWNFNLNNNKEKVDIVNDDAYKVLKNEDKQYDLIFSEPSNTWVSGVEKIYSHEFLQEAAKKLKPHGLYSQWFPLFSTTDASFLSILHNFKKSFRYVTLWSAGGMATIILASHQPIETDLEKLAKKFEENKDIYSSIKRDSAVDMLFHQIFSDSAVTDLALASPIEHSVYRPSLAYQSARAHYTGTNVKLEPLALQFFSTNRKPNIPDENKEMIPVNSGELAETLVWQQLQDQLPEDFFDKGIKFQLQSSSFQAGPLSLARMKFPEKSKSEDIENQKVARKNKENQYLYLKSQNPTIKPKLVKQKGYLATELFQRFTYLSSLREKAYIKNVLEHLPNSCEKEQKCTATKLSILRFFDLESEKQMEELVKEVGNNKELLSKAVDEVFAKHDIR